MFPDRGMSRSAHTLTGGMLSVTVARKWEELVRRYESAEAYNNEKCAKALLAALSFELELILTTAPDDLFDVSEKVGCDEHNKQRGLCHKAELIRITLSQVESILQNQPGIAQGFEQKRIVCLAANINDDLKEIIIPRLYRSMYLQQFMLIVYRLALALVAIEIPACVQLAYPAAEKEKLFLPRAAMGISISCMALAMLIGIYP